MIDLACRYDFPEPEETADEFGLFAIGGDLEPDTLMYAYSHGFFPWGDEPVIRWYCPPVRPILSCRQPLHVSHSLKKTWKRQNFEIKADTAFHEVIENCRNLRRDETWLSDTMKAAYIRLHEMQIAHSVEIYRNGRLAGGLYGLSVGRMFCGESMFHLEADMSKVALLALHGFLCSQGYHFIDVQQMTPLMQSLGAVEMARQDFRAAVKQAIELPGVAGNWQRIFSFPVVLSSGSNQ